MAEPARSAADEPAPRVDPAAIDRAYRLHRARRRARLEQARAARRAGLRFWLIILVLSGVTVFLTVVIWREVQRLFGL